MKKHMEVLTLDKVESIRSNIYTMTKTVTNDIMICHVCSAVRTPFDSFNLTQNYLKSL